MSPLNRGPLLGPRMPPAGMRPPPRFGRHPMPGMPLRMPPPPMPPMGGMFGPMRQRMPPPPPRPGGMMRPGPPPPPPLFGPRGRGPPPLMMPMMGPRCMGPRGPPIRPVPRGILPPQGLPHMRPRFPPGNGNMKVKSINNARKVNKLEELELKKPWMTDEIRSEIQKKNKLYAKSKKNKDAKEWEEFKDLRNKVTRMIRDAKNEYLAKHPDQGGQKTGDKNTVESEGVQETEKCERQPEQTVKMEVKEEMQPTSEQAQS
uniref:Fs(1)K10 protein n=1 Tax=Fopius arisanus TaxID=64838 RepID=A0A0C9S023_9HYME